MNIKVSLDDFGTGHSSYNYLCKLQVDILKIDKSFMDMVLVDSKEKKITESVISLAHDIGLKVVAEGVENYKQLEFLKANNCGEYQGYFFSKPVTAEKMGQILRKSWDY